MIVIPVSSAVAGWATRTVLPAALPTNEKGHRMIARIWRGAVLSEDSDAYADYMQDTGVAGYARTPGNRGVWMLRRDLGDRTEFVMFTLWDSIEAIKAFAGEDYETAVFYPEDDRFLVERELKSAHYELHTRAEPDA
jgi:heme-degrading monooxygenase HmoA